jgi:hypothetical protein
MADSTQKNERFLLATPETSLRFVEFNRRFKSRISALLSVFIEIKIFQKGFRTWQEAGINNSYNVGVQEAEKMPAGSLSHCKINKLR